MRAERTLASILVLLLATLSVPHARAADIAKPTVDLSIYGHVSSVVWIAKDLDPVVDYWEELGLKNIQRTKVREFTDLIYRGKPAPTMARSAFGHVGRYSIEWIQPVTGNNLYTEFLKRHGDGALALGYAVKSDQELEQQIQYFRSKGVAVVQRTQWKGTKGRAMALTSTPQRRAVGLPSRFIAILTAPRRTRRAPKGTTSRSQNSTTTPLWSATSGRSEITGKALGSAACSWFTTSASTVSSAGNRENSQWIWAGCVTEMRLLSGLNRRQGPNVYEEYLKEHGEGLHHVGVDVEDMDAAAKLFAGRGAPTTMGGGWDTPQSKGRFAYLDTDPHGGVTLELLWNQPMPR